MKPGETGYDDVITPTNVVLSNVHFVCSCHSCCVFQGIHSRSLWLLQHCGGYRGQGWKGRPQGVHIYLLKTLEDVPLLWRRAEAVGTGHKKELLFAFYCCWIEQNRTGQNRTEQNWTEQNRTEPCRATIEVLRHGILFKNVSITLSTWIHELYSITRYGNAYESYKGPKLKY